MFYNKQFSFCRSGTSECELTLFAYEIFIQVRSNITKITKRPLFAKLELIIYENCILNLTNLPDLLISKKSEFHMEKLSRDQ